MTQKSKIAFFSVTVGILALHIIYIISKPWMNYDASSYLYIGNLLIDGARPYIDYVEINPPLIHYLHIIPVALSRLTGIHIAYAFSFCVSALTIFSAYFTYVMLKQTIGEQQPLIMLVIPIYILFHPFVRVDTFNDLGQREYLFIIAYFPFFILRWLRWQGYNFDRRLALVIGLIASVGICIKPYFLLIGLIPELYFLLIHRDLMKITVPESLSFLAFGLFYGISFLLTPDSTAVLLNEILPALAYGYSSFNSRLTPPEYILYNLHFFIPLAIASWIAFQLRQKYPIITHFIVASVLGAIVSLAVVIIQAKNFSYHYNPFYFFVQMLGMVSIALITQVSTKNTWIKFERMAFIFVYSLNLSVAGMMIGAISIITHNAERTSFFNGITAENDYILLIQGSHSIGYPEILMMNRRYANSYIVATPIDFELAQFQTREEVYGDGVPFINQPIENYLNSLENDIRTKQPVLILIADYCPCPTDFSLHEYLTRVGFINDYVLPDYQMLPPLSWIYVYQRNERE